MDVEGERARLQLKLAALARLACGDWHTVPMSGQDDRLREYKRERGRVLARLRALRRIERHRARTDKRRASLAEAAQ